MREKKMNTNFKVSAGLVVITGIVLYTIGYAIMTIGGTILIGTAVVSTVYYSAGEFKRMNFT